MKILCVLLVLSSYGWAQCPAADSALRYKISENNRYGFIDETGQVIIPPQYFSAGEFSEGSCPVRIKGKFGYINPDGAVCIAPIYDFATEFKGGLAQVFLDGKPFFIDANGRKAFESNYVVMTQFIDGRSYVKTASGKMGVITTTGKLVIDTVYKEINDFRDGLAIVYGLKHREENPDGSDISEVSVIDSKGNLLLPFGAYRGIQNNAEGYFQASRPLPGEGNDWEYHLFKGKKLVYKFPEDKGYMSGPVSNGILRLLCDKDPGGSTSGNDLYYAYMRPSGKSVYKNTNANSGNDFQDHRAFIEVDNNVWLIDTAGNVLAQHLGSRVSDKGFENGKALVKDSMGWNVIDHDGKVILKTPFEEVYEFLHDDFLFYADNVDEDSQGLYGVMDMNGTVLISPMMDSFDPSGFENGLLMAVVKKRLTYFNRSGKIVWQESEGVKQNEALNIDYMNRGYFYVSFDSRGDDGDHEEKISRKQTFKEAALVVVADTKKESSTPNVPKGFEVLVVNNTSSELWFNAQDTRLYMKMQAKDLTGTWRDIEYLPSSWCGNSYHTIGLSKNHYWKFTAPHYTGEFNTKLRIELSYIDPTDFTADDRGRRNRNKKQLFVYSNEFDGSINPAQFWRKPEYYPGGIMDPYFD